jgi:hypothetical protein
MWSSNLLILSVVDRGRNRRSGSMLTFPKLKMVSPFCVLVQLKRIPDLITIWGPIYLATNVEIFAFL